MAAQDPQEDELKSLKEKNTELVQKVQYWKMTAAQRENEKLELMKEINELRLKVIRLKSGGAAEARKLDAALQSASEEALSHLVQASSAVARTIELAKTYMRAREGLETVSPRWSNISNSNEKVHRVPPMMIGGQSIQPVVSLSRATFNLNGSRQTTRSPNSTRNVTVRAVPMHMLQDVYIPLTRIDMRPAPSSEPEPAANDSAENIPFDTSMEETPEEPENITDEDFDATNRLDIVTEDVEAETEELTPSRARADNPLEGPSWLLDARGSGSGAFEPDSTTEEARTPPPQPERSPEPAAAAAVAEPARVFTPTVRRRKRTSTPPQRHTMETSLNGMDALETSRVLQVLVPKMRLSVGETPPKRRAAPRFDAPSPNGATDAGVIVSEETETNERRSEPNQSVTNRQTVPHDSPRNTDSHNRGHGDSRDGRNGNSDGDTRDNRRGNGDSHGDGRANCSRGDSRDGRHGDSDGDTRDNRHGRDNCSRGGGDSDSDGGGRASEGRTRRNRKPVTYKEKPLNRKLRR